jgi:hypothetical protein
MKERDKLHAIYLYLYNENQSIFQRFSLETIKRAMADERLDVVEYMYQVGYISDPYLLFNDTRNGELDALVAQLTNDTLHVDVMELAIKSGNVPMVKYLREQREFELYHLWFALKSGNMQMIQYLVDSGHLTSKEFAISVSTENNHIEIVEYLKMHMQ